MGLANRNWELQFATQNRLLWIKRESKLGDCRVSIWHIQVTYLAVFLLKEKLPYLLTEICSLYYQKNQYVLKQQNAALSFIKKPNN